jgi:hypothetical protein
MQTSQEIICNICSWKTVFTVCHRQATPFRDRIFSNVMRISGEGKPPVFACNCQFGHTADSGLKEIETGTRKHSTTVHQAVLYTVLKYIGLCYRQYYSTSGHVIDSTIVHKAVL